MHRLTNRHILIGITGGIAAYKAAELTRLFKGVGADVRVVLTDAGAEFITPLTLQALSGNPVHQSLLDPEAEQGMGHIELARWADLIIVAPATADFMARFAGGMANDLLTTLCLATDAPIALAPAMNQAMWRDPRTQQNLETLLSQGVNIFGPGSGEQACGDTGPGRMIEPTEILASCANLIANGPLNEKSVVITAGPTREAIDPVRFISNHSSGKMGFELAAAAAKAGAKVTLIAGPVSLPTPKGVRRVDVESAEQMLEAALIASEQADIFIGAAAVADYRPQLVAEQKIKKGAEEVMEILLTKNPDIIATIAAQPERPLMIGFAAETENLVEYARSKLVRKGLDLVIANDVSQADIGFNADQNEVILVGPNGELPLPKAGKSELAEQLISHISQLMD
ncbi:MULTISPECIES: bifunctional phosphopantothenoylcysteine decarboxylase/phosphopantothenate--cysteine ligase CoaBC [unclassified Marinobacterium]|uniref:bifunctional phosphopantothenoylcysteine decarboxylase/phosphopantothenate--cysteine ligase CoaBC n=1 Tax=unclassified Marinobacterium TaxID=2644139 RepID=UPI001568F120|nr:MULTISPECIES: bifunctional phosphopantothenoylcysteine decarboxylase/phosphopantothenate--cysteine ligase CoaBC [unclassified Marinobacterium]NRP14897.1 Coenzyme A biosynthesis bifunctional protein CoaBC [Marinobacterium sp. xm-a-152]NRP58150.1 Coenzyme A biosynthesis bifunctional protein CoaBC [Marinobacterium sp. xm-d-510]NRP59279.1 Coenzyme A biosynthesis bifunctional protein CoaBC [Marinobacterium sp. xm-d-564]NRP98380.1 Coenzyme A biosynthesis bifunctional protein CoaBC [Marinobacterium